MIQTDHFQKQLECARSAHQVQYRIVAELKLAVLRLLFETFQREKDPERALRFHEFYKERQSLLDRACLFQALRAYHSSQELAQANCDGWPEEHRNLKALGVARFAEEQKDMVRFQLWLQWIADEQLSAAAHAAGEMAIGLYRDLAVGAGPGGAETWSHPDSLVLGASVGAPPDKLSPSGQNWGLPPLHPVAVREHAYSTFIDLVRSNMRYAGGLRVDHAMALQRLYWIPKGNEAKDGAYVRYPMEDLIGILALESHRNQCLVVGEDLGTVPAGFRERMTKANILSYRVLFFEKDDEAFVPPDNYPTLALAVAGNHDLSTIRGWWQGNDIALKERLGLFPDGSEQTRGEREQERRALLRLLTEQNLVTPEGDLNVEMLAQAVYALLGRTNCLIAMVQLDDVTGEEEQVNLPGTADENPNWRRRLSCTLEEIASDPRFLAITNVMMRHRGAVPLYQS